MTDSSRGPAYQHVYVHVPFCGRRCSYCDFAIAVRRVVPVSEYVDAIMAELVTRGSRIDGPGLRSLYLGGGTPSKLGGAGVAALISRIAQHAGVNKFSTSGERSGPGPEITIEINPEDVDAESVAAWVAAGVNRASVGVQTFDPAVLAWMHREHSPEQVALAVQLLRAGGITDLSLDLIFAVPDHLHRDWARDLDGILALEPNHVSIYGLTIEPLTPLGRWTARGDVTEAREERYEEEFLLAHRTLGGAGFEHYEVSNYGRPGHRAVHNSSYWAGVPYLGLGPSAHGFDGTVRRWNHSAYAAWLRAVREGADPVEGSETLTASDRESERVYLGLRTTDGLELRQNEWTTVTSWIEAGWASRRDERLVLSPTGWLRLDALAASLTALRSRS
jgi:oxygen-independent coproporphyrinogen-3 oxidase